MQKLKEQIIKLKPFTLLLTIFVIAFALMQISRMAIVYLNGSHTLGVPDYYFSDGKVGHDWNLNTADPGYLLHFSVPINWFWGYGYGPPVAYATIPYLLSLTNICTIQPQSCGYLLYNVLVGLSFVGFLGLAIIVPKALPNKLLAVIFFLVSTLGIGFSRAVESGNVDLPISCVYGWLTYLIFRSNHKKDFDWGIALLVGFTNGFFLSTKLAVIPFVIAFLLTTPKKIVAVSVLVLTFFIFSLIPQVYGVKTKVTDIYSITEMTLSAMRKDVFESYPHGNMSLRASASGIYHFSQVSLPTSLRNYIIQLLSMLFMVAMVGPSIRYFLLTKGNSKHSKITIYSYLHRFFIFCCHKKNSIYLFSVCCIALIIFPIVAFEYRLIYFIPIFILWLSKDLDNLAPYFYLAISLYLFKNVWILHGSVTTIIFYGALVSLLLEITHQMQLEFTKQL